ncbi:MAG: hypothetical protein AAGD25_34780 [Cyanobacteria bacterium P01_F01_bin.150]
MAGLNNLVQKAFYLGVGIASYAGEKAGENLSKLRTQAQKLADEMVARGEITAEEAKKMVDDMVTRAQNPSDATVDVSAQATASEPRTIEIIDETDASDSTSSDTSSKSSANEALRQQVADLEEQLRKLRQ